MSGRHITRGAVFRCNSGRWKRRALWSSIPRGSSGGKKDGMGGFEDCRHAIRSLRKAPVFAATTILALALGIGAATAIFCVANAVLLKPLPYPDPGRIVVLTTTSPGGRDVWVGSPAQFLFLPSHVSTLELFSAYRFSAVDWTGMEYPRQIRAAYITGDYFRLFGQSVSPGRAFRAEECQPGGPPVVILSPAFWERSFGRSPDVLGGNMSLAG